MNKKNIIILSAIVVLLALFFIFKKGNNYDYKDLKLYKKNDSYESYEVNLTDDEKQAIIKYLKKEKFIKKETKCAYAGNYSISFDNIKISFDNNNDCGALYENSNTMENYNTNISTNLKNYIINIKD